MIKGRRGRRPGGPPATVAVRRARAPRGSAPTGGRSAPPGACEADRGEKNPPAGRGDRTSIESLGLEVGRSFGYWFDFGDDWWHQINVEAIEDEVPGGKFPRLTNRVGEDPPQSNRDDG